MAPTPAGGSPPLQMSTGLGLSPSATATPQPSTMLSTFVPTHMQGSALLPTTLSLAGSPSIAQSATGIGISLQLPSQQQQQQKHHPLHLQQQQQIPHEEVLRQAFDLVQNELLPAIEACGRDFYDAIDPQSRAAATSDAAAQNPNDMLVDGDATEEAGQQSRTLHHDPIVAEAKAKQLHALLSQLLVFLEQNGLSGLPLATDAAPKAGDQSLSEGLAQLRDSAREQFQKRDRLRDAAGIVRGILHAS